MAEGRGTGGPLDIVAVLQLVIASGEVSVFYQLFVVVLDVLVGVLGVHVDGLHGAVGENGAGLGSIHRDVAAVAVIAGDEHILILAGVQLRADEVAVLIHKHGVGLVHQLVGVELVQGVVLVESLLVVVVGLAVGGHLGHAVLAASVRIVILVHAALEGGDLLILADLHIEHVGNNLVGASVQHIAVPVDQAPVVLLHVHDEGGVLQLNPLGDGAVDAVIDGHGDGLAVAVVVGRGTGQPGVDGHNVELIAVVVQIHLGQHAAAGAVQIGVVVAGENALRDIGVHRAVQIGQQGVVTDGSLAHQLVNGLALYGCGVGLAQQLLLGVGADLRAGVDPGRPKSSWPLSRSSSLPLYSCSPSSTV